MPDVRGRVIDRIHKLREINQQRGATEAEAWTAATLVAALVAKYNLTLTELDVTEHHYANYPLQYDEAHVVALARVCEAIAKLTDTVGMRSGPTIAFFGAETDCVLAHHLAGICQAAIRKGLANYDPAGASAEQQANLRMSFERGIADRLRERILFLNEQRHAYERDRQRTGNAVAIAKGAHVRQALMTSGITMQPAPPQSTTLDFHAYIEGQKQGMLVPLLGEVVDD